MTVLKTGLHVVPGSICCCLRVICKSVLMSVFETFYYYIVFAEYSSICSINTSPLAYITYRLYSNTLIIHFSENHENSMRGRSQHFEGDTRPLRLDINCVLHCKNKIIVRYTISITFGLYPGVNYFRNSFLKTTVTTS